MSPADFRRLFRLLAERFQATRCSQVASSLAFTTLLSLVPLVTLAIVLFGRFPVFDTLGLELRTFLVQNLLPDKAGRIITTYALQFSQKAANLTLLGSLLLGVGAFTLLLTIDRVFNQIWGVRQPRRWTVRVPLYWATLTVGPLVLAGAVTASSYVISASMGLVDEPLWVRSLVFRTAPFLLLVGFIAFLYRTIPNRPVDTRHALIGALLATALLALIQKALTLLIASFSAFTLIYGTFAALPIFLLWLYLSWVAVLVGALIASTLPAWLDHRPTLPAFPGDTAYAAMRMLARLEAAQRDGATLASESLDEAAMLASADGEWLLESMRDAGWVARTDAGEWLLTVPAGQLTVADVTARFALAPGLAPGLPNDALTAALAQTYRRSLAHAAVPLESLTARGDQVG